MEEVLERHRSKLQEHRQFLQSYKTASLDVSRDGHASSHPTAPSPDATLFTVDGTHLTDRSTDGAPSPAARAPPSADSEGEGTHDTLYLHSATAGTSAHGIGKQTPHTPHKQTSRSTENKDDVADVDALLRSRGRYKSSQPPDAMYIKSQAWLQRRQWQNEAARHAQEEEEREACTFAPRLSSVDAARTYTDAEDEQWIDAAATVRRARGHTTAAGTSPSQPEAGVRHASRQRQPTVGILSDQAVVKHMTRLEAARKRKEEDEKRVRGVNIDKWRNETTKPRPFHLGVRSAEPIPSLRKPYVTGLDKAHYDPSALMNTDELSVVDLLKTQLRHRDLVIDDQEREILHLQQELREVKAMLIELTSKDKGESRANTA